MNPLSTFEAARLSAIVEEAIERFTLLEHITPDVTAQRDDLAEAVGSEIARIIDEQQALQQRYEILLGQRHQLKLAANKTKLAETQQEIEKVSKDLTQVTQALCRHIKENPNISENLKKIQRDRSDLIALLRKTVDELHVNSMRSLKAAVDSEKQQQDALLETIARQKENQRMVEQLQKSLASEKADRRRDKDVRAATIAELKEKLAKLREESEMKTHMLKKETSAHLNAQQRLHAQRISELEEELAMVTRKLEIENRVTSESTKYLTRKNDVMVLCLSFNVAV
eukprot:TRINITY_DN2989_c0_g1_i3.p1 TRINITY_DN2989_c0_g1~~TRINITY_DN2989_c0_g1_i3.p1  ORF type:complete len:284 (-),score=58.69 TRINITY_DN2989_c0_g1_i3:468-1319(-)